MAVEAVVVEAVEAARTIPIAPSNVTMMMPTALCAQVFAPVQTIVIRPCAAQTFLSAATTVPMVLINMVLHVTAARVDILPRMNLGLEMHGSLATARLTVVLGARQCSGALVLGCVP